MARETRLPLRGLDEGAALRTLMESTAEVTGAAFFAALVRNLAEVLHTHGAWVTEYLEKERRLRALAFWMDDRFLEGYEHGIDGTPCEKVIDTAQLVLVPNNVMDLYPIDPDLREIGAVSYMGVPLQDIDGRVMGHLAVLDTRPLPAEPRCVALFRVFASRAAAELRRLREEERARERETKLRQLVDSALDPIVELDSGLTVTLANAAAEVALRATADTLVGHDVRPFLDPAGRGALAEAVRQLEGCDGPRHAPIAGGLSGARADGEPFTAEATLSCYEVGRQTRFTLILRDLLAAPNAGLQGFSISSEAEYLREEIAALHRRGEILGRSPALVRVLQDIAEVAPTDATALISGETGTGKELVARAIHGAGRRQSKPLVKVNCAAIPANLMESEFFGHEPGAFTGATQKRDGRFALADGGTLFLDEVGELPLDLQPKLLRVLQEGEFEPVGSSKTRRVDVRVIAASNRDLLQAVREGKFREDLYYRLSVFPIEMPPLRDRREDIPLLAAAFAERCASRTGRAIAPLTAGQAARLQAYDWPGNVRELQNVIERAVITSRDGRLNLDRALPAAAPAVIAPLGATDDGPGRVRTADELRDLERDNLVRALESTGWRISGKDGAASLLGMPPSTLTSRMKALGIRRP